MEDAAHYQYLPLSDPRYPAALRAIPDPPPGLYCRGDPRVLAGPVVAMVGSRGASRAGLHIAAEVARRLGAAGYTVCSGLALGIDAAAHRGSLETGRGIAVLASGVDIVYPGRHRPLARQLLQRGCLVSEQRPGTPAVKHHFPARNRIISGLAQATIIVEAALPSGTLHTAAAALEQGRDVYVLPWSIFHPQGAGCLRLLRDGATPITEIDELDGYFPTCRQTRATAPQTGSADTAPPEDEIARLLLQLIGDEALSKDALQAASGLEPAPLAATLAGLELDGHLTLNRGLYSRATGKPCQHRGSC